MARSKLLDRIVMLGDTQVGKTQLLYAAEKKAFSTQHKPTIGADFGTIVIETPTHNHTIQIWDTAGQERFQSLSMSFLRDVDAVFVCFALNNTTSFDNIDQHVAMARTVEPDAPIFLVGTKCDLVTDIQIYPSMILRKKQSLNIHHYFETSAFTGHNVQHLFETAPHQLEQDKTTHTQNAAQQAIEQISKHIQTELKAKGSPIRTHILTSANLQDDQGKKQRVYKGVQKINTLCQQAMDPKNKLSYVQACQKIHTIIHDKELRLGNSRWDRLVLWIRDLLGKLGLGVKPKQRAELDSHFSTLLEVITEKPTIQLNR